MDWLIFGQSHFSKTESNISIYLDTPLKPVTCIVPQGSTFDPLLFCLYIYDLQSVFSKLHVHQFSDDTNLLFSV